MGTGFQHIQPLPGTWALSHSQVDAFSQCRLKWYANYVARLEPVERPARLAIGSAWHKVIEHYRQAQIDGGALGDQVEAAKWTIDHILEFVPSVYVDDEIDERLRWALAGYVERWAEIEVNWEYLAVEVPIRQPLIGGVTFVGFVDYIKRDRRTGKIRAGDTKTSSGKDLSKEYYSADLSFDPQFMRYAGGLRRAGVEISGFEWDAVRMDKLKRAMVMDERYNRINGDLSNTEAVESAWTTLQELAEEINAVRQGASRIYSTPVAWICKSRCDFYAAHQLAADTGRDFEQACIDYGHKRRAEPLGRLIGGRLAGPIPLPPEVAPDVIDSKT